MIITTTILTIPQQLYQGGGVNYKEKVDEF